MRVALESLIGADDAPEPRRGRGRCAGGDRRGDRGAAGRVHRRRQHAGRRRAPGRAGDPPPGARTRTCSPCPATRTGRRSSRCSAPGAAGYVVKGIAPEDLLAAIHRTAEGQSTLSPAVTDGVVGELAEHLARDEASKRRHDATTDAIGRVLAEGQFHMVFQPICRLRSGHPIGFEALARFGMEPRQPPDVWFSQAADVGMLLELEIEAVKAALPTLEKLPPGSFLSVNVSPSTIVSPRFLSALVATGRGSQIVVEVTEHAPITDYDAVNAAMDRLRAHGVRLAVDDAGAGFALAAPHRAARARPHQDRRRAHPPRRRRPQPAGADERAHRVRARDRRDDRRRGPGDRRADQRAAVASASRSARASASAVPRRWIRADASVCACVWRAFADTV